jgi:ABC-2 type transport system ATP-binding protein
MAAATMHDPELIFLDEPTAGIDPVTRKELWDLFYTLTAEGKTLFVTTHYMEEAERCNRLAFLNRGRLIAQGTPQEIRESLHGMQVYLSRVSHDPELNRELLEIDGVQLVNQFGGDLRIIAQDSVPSERLQETIARHRGTSVEVTAVDTSIEDAFMSITSDDGGTTQ